MEVGFAIHDPKRHRFVVRRDPHPAIDVLYESRSMLLHDFAHYAIESSLQTDAGFYGWLARGVDPAILREGGGLADDDFQALMAIEGHVARLQSAFKKRLGPTDTEAWRILRSVNGAWLKVKNGEMLWLTWPSGPPEIRPTP